MSDLKTLVWIALILAVISVATLVAAHERHYAKRSTFLLQRRVQALEDLLLEDRTV